MNFAPQFLKHGLALCGKNFPRVVETWNWLSDFCVNLKGDADVDAASGSIKVDRTNPAHPVIRFVGSAGGGSDGGESKSATSTAFQAELVYETDGIHDDVYLTAVVITNCYYMVGGRVGSWNESFRISYTEGGVIALVLSSNDSGLTFDRVTSYPSMTAVMSAQNNSSMYVFPLYLMISSADGHLVDLRTMPQIQAFEYSLI